jgi:dihydroorotase
MDELTITRPDDWHLHVRDGDALNTVVPHTASQFARAIIMPNLKPPVTTVDQAAAYRQRILAAVPDGTAFEPLMTLYLTDNTPADEIVRASESDFVHAVKYYPAGATTHSDAGVTKLENVFDTLAVMEEHDLPLLVHGETTDETTDVFDREKAFIHRQLVPITEQFPKLRIVFEHITTLDAVDFVMEAGDNVAATITVHHLLMNRNAMFDGGIRPHHYCLPLLKHERHRTTLLEAATSGHARFFLGTDSAPHSRASKESACGCAGIYTAHAALALYAEAFEAMGRLDRLEAFASHHGADFYRLPRNTGTITLKKESWQVPGSYAFGGDTLIPLRAGETLHWKVAE